LASETDMLFFSVEIFIPFNTRSLKHFSTHNSSQFTDHRSPFTDLLSVVTKERRLINFFKHPPAPLESVLSSSFNISHPKRRPNKKCFSSFHMENGNIRTS